MFIHLYAASRSFFTRFVILVAVIALALNGCSNQSVVEEKEPTPLPTPIIPIKPTYRVMKGEVIRKLEFTARIIPVIQQDLFFKSAGRVDKILVKKGDQVKKGLVLATLEGGSNAVDLRRAEINLEIARLNLKLAEVTGQKWSQTYPITIVMKNYEIELAQLSLDQIALKVDSTVIKSGIDGIVLSVTLTEGSPVEAYKGVIVVANLNDMEASADLKDKDMQSLIEKIPVKMSPLNSPGKTVDGFIRKLPYPFGKASPTSTSKETDDQSTRISITGKLDDLGLTMGDLVRVVAKLEKSDNTLYLPPQAIRAFEGRQFAVVQDGNGQRRVDVKLGIAADDRIEILDGLTEGQIVLAP